jgi:chemotaxis family two-component system sensor kinase Cph1
VVKDLSRQISDKKATIQLGGLPTIMGHDRLIYHLFFNLISNSLKFSGNNPPQIEVSAEKTEKEFLFSVKDYGVGIEPIHAKSLFVLFRRLPNGLKYSGSGMGLPLCRKIVEKHGGKIWVESQAVGAKLCFSLPIKTASPTVSPHRHRPKARASPTLTSSVPLWQER